MALSSIQHIAALQHPWHAKRAKPPKMLRESTPCLNAHASSRETTPVDKENIRKQVVGLAAKRDTESVQEARNSGTTSSTSVTPAAPKRQLTQILNANTARHELAPPKHSRQTRTSRNHMTGSHDIGDQLLPFDTHETLRHPIRRSNTMLHGDTKTKPKIVRFRMENFTIGNQKTAIVNITDNAKPGTDGKLDLAQPYEVRGSGIQLRKEGLKGLLAYKDICTDNEKRQTNLQSSLKIFRRRIKLNQDKFIQPNESTAEDYVVYSPSPFLELPALHAPMEEEPVMRPVSNADHVRLLRSALQNKHTSGPTHRPTDTHDTGETKNIKCSYRLPENHGWSKEVSFKDIKDDAIPNVKTYVLEEDKNPRLKKGHVENTVTLNIHNVGVHNSITQVSEKKVKLGESEASFDPRFLDWLRDSYSNAVLCRNTTILSDENIEGVTPARRRISAKC